MYRSNLECLEWSNGLRDTIQCYLCQSLSQNVLHCSSVNLRLFLKLNWPNFQSSDADYIPRAFELLSNPNEVYFKVHLMMHHAAKSS